MNARISKVNDHITSEALAHTTTISWSPTEGPQAASITFQCAKYFKYVDGSYFGAPEPDGSLTFTVQQLLGRKVPLMLPGGQIIGEQPVELLDAMMRGLFDMLYNETRYAPDPQPEPPLSNTPVTP